jgi:tripartite-type tricarboxylate transporter receptor subunit TctC
MKELRRICLSMAGTLVLALAILPMRAAAQAYPQKPIRIVVPFPAGGIADTLSRTIAGKLNEAWGQPVVVENRPGAGGNIAADLVAKSPPDGYTLVMGSIGTHAVNISLFKSMPYDPVRDFTPVAFAVEAEGLLVVHPSVPANSVKELIALAKAQPDKLTYASAGAGTASHLAGELFKSSAQVNITHIPYKGNVPAITDLLGGQTSMLFATMPTVLPQVKAGKLRALAVTGAQRSAAAAEIPTVAESGLPGFEVTNWIGFFAPAGTPAEVVSKLNAEILRIMRTAEVQKRLESEGARFTPMTPGEFGQFVRNEIAKWARVIRDAGMSAE